ncbi:inositol monophosphatase family protein [Gemmatimonadota bacterium]
MEQSGQQEQQSGVHLPRDLVTYAEEAARECGNLLIESWRQPKRDYEEKAPGDLVSETDRASEGLARSILLTHTPDARFLAEESAGTRAGPSGEDHLTWIVDPLDGTTNFLHRFPIFAVSIAAARGRELLAGVVYIPVTDECFSAGQGLGATLNGQSISVSPERDLSRGLLATGWPFRRKEILESYFEVFTRVLRSAQGIRRAGAAAVDLAYTAAGRLDGFWEYGLSIWDVAAGALLIQEAGGSVSDFAGREQWWTSGDIVATNGAIHDALLTTAATPNGISDLEIHA